MNQKAAAVIFCALLLSTLALEHHEKGRHLQHHEKHQVNHHQGKSHHARSHPLLSRANEKSCTLVCTFNNSLTIVFNETTKIIGIVNVTAEVAIAIDISANLIAVFNGSSGAVVIINVQSQTGVYLNSSSQYSWSASKESFVVYINSITSLSVLYQSGTAFSISSASVVVLEIVAGVLIYLSFEYAVALTRNASKSITILIEFYVRFSAVFSGSLQGFFALVSSSVFVIRYDILWFLSVVEGLAVFFARIQGGIAALVAKSIKFDLQYIFAAESGFALFIYLIGVLAVHYDLTVILVGVFSNVEEFLFVIVSLGGNIYVGFVGFIRIIYAIYAVVQKNVSIEVLIDYLVKYSVGGALGVSVIAEFNSTASYFLEIIAYQVSIYNNSASFTLVVAFFESFNAQSLIVAGVNIYAALVILAKVGAIAAIDLVIGFLYVIRAIITVELAIAQLFLTLFGYLNTTVGLLLVIQFVPSINISQEIDIYGSVNVIGIIVASLKISDIISSGFNLTVILSRLAIIGNIYTAIVASLKIQTGGSITIVGVFQSQSASAVVVKIWAWLSAIFNFNFSSHIGIGIGTKHLGHHPDGKHHKVAEKHHRIGEKHLH